MIYLINQLYVINNINIISFICAIGVLSDIIELILYNICDILSYDI